MSIIAHLGWIEDPRTDVNIKEPDVMVLSTY